METTSQSILLLREYGLTLEKALKLCRAFEQSNKHVKELRSNFASNALNSSAEVNKISRRPSLTANDQQNSTDEDRTSNQDMMSTLQFDCKYCGYKHERKREKYPPWGKKCDKCKGPNHFKSKCKKMCMQSHSLVISMIILMTNGSWPLRMMVTASSPHSQ